MHEHPNNADRLKVWLDCFIPVFMYMIILTWIPCLSIAASSSERVPYTIIDTTLVRCYNNNTEIEFPKAGTAFFGQDAQYTGKEPAYKDNGDGTVTDKATGLMWIKVDSGNLKAGKNRDGKLNWQEALDWAENLEYAGYSDWRLPNVKELQSIVDYTRSPATTNSAAIDPVFQTTSFIAESGQKDYPFYWSGTTHAGLSRADTTAYVAFGRSFGWMRNRRTGQYVLMDVHGAGSQRSDPKSGNPSRFPFGRGPQGDVIRIYNFVRCVRGGTAEPYITGRNAQ